MRQINLFYSKVDFALATSHQESLKENCGEENIICRYLTDLREGYLFNFNKSSYSDRTLSLSSDQGTRFLSRRDSIMANNMSYLFDVKYPNKKIIVWCSAYHIHRNSSMLHGKYPEFYLQRSFWDRLYAKYGSDSYSAPVITSGGYCGYSHGKYNKKHVLKNKKLFDSIPSAPKESVEYALERKGLDVAFIDFTRNDGNRLLTNSEFLMWPTLTNPCWAPWAQIYDGALYIKDMAPVQMPADESTIRRFNTKPTLPVGCKSFKSYRVIKQ